MDTARSMELTAFQPLSSDVLREKYALPGERSVDDVRQRIARALAGAEQEAARASWEGRFLAAQRAGFIPAGRIACNAGTTLGSTLINCFVQPIGDSISSPEDGHPAIYAALAEASETLRRGGGVGYDFSRIRPRGALVASTRAHAAGPLAFLHVFDAASQTLESDSRRAAQMGVLRCDHPDISLAFADNVSAGIEPAYAWSYQRHRRAADGPRSYQVEDHAWRVWQRVRGGRVPLPPAFVGALELSPHAQLLMVAAVAPFIDGSISKTVNMDEHTPFRSFEPVFLGAWRSGLKGLAAFRPNRMLGAVLTPSPLL